VRNLEQHSLSSLRSGLRKTVFALALLCALTMVAALSAQAQTFTVLHTFQENDGAFPNGGLIADGAGNLYGTTQAGALPGCNDNRGCGEAFQLHPHGSGWVLNVLHRFTGMPDGATPFGQMTFGPDGEIYATTSAGGMANANCSVDGCGTVYKLRPPPTQRRKGHTSAFVSQGCLVTALIWVC
jgi:hypothetical protein